MLQELVDSLVELNRSLDERCAHDPLCDLMSANG
jgi:hypothetical protein